MPVVDTESDGELQSSSSSDSDSSEKVPKGKRAKLRIKPTAMLQKSKKKKYDVWSKRAQEDVLLETMNNFDVTKKDRSRNVETYDFTLSYSYKERTTNKRTKSDRDNKSIRPVNKVSDEVKAKTKPRKILRLKADVNCSDEELASEIANRLCEEKADLICTIVAVLGKQKAINIFEKVRKIEQEGGMLIMVIHLYFFKSFYFFVKEDLIFRIKPEGAHLEVSTCF